MSEILVTQRQQEIYEFIAHYIDEHGYSPTRQEIADHFGFSLNAAQCHLRALAKKGAITMPTRISRGIRLA